jgi:hypothetical protein
MMYGLSSKFSGSIIIIICNMCFILQEKETILHVTDYSLDSQQSYSMIHVSNACDFFTKASTLSERVILVLRDLFVSNGKYCRLLLK